MHISEGFLPIAHAAAWTAISAPFVAHSIRTVGKTVREHPEQRILMGVSGAFTFALSALKMPSVTGSCSHPTGTGLGSILMGPAAMPLIGTIVLLFQAVLLAHGGLTTLGANVFSMAIAGPWIAYAVYRLSQRIGLQPRAAGFLAAVAGVMATYSISSLQLALAFPDAASGVAGAMVKFMGIFAVTQIPLAIAEGILTVIVLNWLQTKAHAEAGSASPNPGVGD